MTRKLDKTRKYGTVVGASDGRAFYQDGHYFNGGGDA